MKITSKAQVQNLLDYNGMFWVKIDGLCGLILISSKIWYQYVDGYQHGEGDDIFSDIPNHNITFHSWVTPPPLEEGEEVYFMFGDYEKKSFVTEVHTDGTFRVSMKYYNDYNSLYAVPTRLFEEEKKYTCPEIESMDAMVTGLVMDWQTLKNKLNKQS